MDLIKEYTEKELMTVTIPKDFFVKIGSEYKQMKTICDKFCKEAIDLKKELGFYKNTSFEKDYNLKIKSLKDMEVKNTSLEARVKHLLASNNYLISRCSDLEYELQELFEDVKRIRQMNSTFEGECPF
jgi:predicted nuclease with TOPRIM domain